MPYSTRFFSDIDIDEITDSLSSGEMRNLPGKPAILKEIENSGILQEFYARKELALECIKKNALDFNDVPDDIRYDRDFILSVIMLPGSDEGIIEEIPMRFKADKEVMLTAVAINPLMLEYASEPLKNDKELVLAALLSNGLAVEDASLELRNDKLVFLVALLADDMNEGASWLQQYASGNLQQDPDLQKLSQMNEDRSEVAGQVFESWYLSPTMSDKEKYECVLNLVKQYPEVYVVLPEKYKIDDQIVNAAVEKHGPIIWKMNDDFKKNRVLALKAVAQNPAAFKYLDMQMQKDRLLTKLSQITNTEERKEFAQKIAESWNKKSAKRTLPSSEDTPAAKRSGF